MVEESSSRPPASKDGRQVRRKPALGSLVGNLGRAGLALAGAEARAIQSDLVATGRIALRSSIWGIVALALGLWGGAALTGGLVVLAAKFLTLVQALLLVGVVLLCLAVAAGVMARRRVRQLESPVQSVKRRAGDHLTWWQKEITGDSDHQGGGGS